VPAALEPLLDAFWPGPLTVVLPRHPDIPDIVTSGLSTVAVRMPGHPVARAVLRSFGGPLAAPSANRFGRVSPTCAAHVRAEFGARTPFLLDGGPSTHGLESTIVAWRGGRVMILRDGAIPRHEIERVTGAPARSRRGTVLKHPDAPGLLRHHYAPRARVVLLPADWRSAPPASDRRAALLLFRGPIPVGWTRAVVLSPRGSLRVAARRFYAVLRDLDRPGIRAIYADGFPDGGLGDALNDRLRRASARA
jgi:L-threonylcarbamoyladenylate synthase